MSSVLFPTIHPYTFATNPEYLLQLRIEAATDEMYPDERALDNAFTQCQEIVSKNLFQRMSCKLCRAYLSLNAYEKAYYVLLHEFGLNQDPRLLSTELPNIIRKCHEINTIDALIFAEGIHERHKNEMILVR